MKTFEFVLIILSLLGSIGTISAQSYPYITGNGSSADATVHTLAKTGETSTYKILFGDGKSWPSGKSSLVSWAVEGGDIVSQNGNVPSVDVKWHTGRTQGKIEARNVYDKAQSTLRTINSTIFLEDEQSAVQGDLQVQLSKDFLFVNESFSVNWSYSVNYVSISCSSEGLTQSPKENGIGGSYTTPGFKDLTVRVHYRTKLVASVTKTILVIPSDIVGADVVCSGLTETYTVPNLPAGVSVNNWTLTEDVGLYIVSGQGTNTITVRSNSYGNVKVNANVVYNGQTKTLSKSVLANTPRVQTISGPAGPVYAGSILYLTAYPQYPPSICTYEWSIIPTAGTNLAASGATAMIGVQGTGTYEVRCRVIPSCGVAPVSMFASYRFTAERRTNYKVSVNVSSRQINLIAENNSDIMSSKNQKSLIQYELYRMETGTLVKKNSLPASGGTIETSEISNGLYLLKIVDGEAVESHKIILK